MGVAIPQVIAEDRASGAQIIDGSIVFDRSKLKHLKKTISTTGNQKTFTVSFWFKKQLVGNVYQYFFTTEYLGSGSYFEITSNSDQFHVYGGSGVIDVKITRKLRDTNGWMHAVVAIDSTIATPASDRVKIYLNGERQEDYVTGSSDFPPQNHLFTLEGSRDWYVGTAEFQGTVSSSYYDGQMSQVYFIDNQALGPEYFGFTDPLTNTWRPKKYTDGFSYTLTAPTYSSSDGSDVTTTEFDKMVDGDLSTYGQGTGASGQNRFIGFSLPATEYPTINIKIKNTTNSALDFHVQPDTGSGYANAGIFASSGSSFVNVAGGVTLEDTYTFPSNYSGTGRILLNNSGNAADAWEIYDFGGTKLTTNSFYLPFDGNSPIGEDKSGNGNNWTPVSFGGSNTIEKATGALPILNTVSGGNAATVGVRTDATVAAGVGTCVLALPFANPGGSTEDVSNKIDSRSTEKVITESGNAVGFSTNNFYGRGWYFDGQSTTYVEAAASNDFVVGTGDFTIEGWFNPNATQTINARLWGQQTTAADNDYDCYINAQAGTNSIYMNGGNTDLGMNFPTAGEWHHIAVCRSGTNLYSFMNGALKRINSNYTNTLGTNNDTFRVAKIGGNNTGYAFAGGVQDFRFYNGVAKYTSDFIPASINPDILPDTPSGVSGNSELAKIANGSVGFAGTSRLSIQSTSDLNFSTDNFTIEGFFNKVTTTGGNQTLLASQKYYTAGNNGNWVLRITDNANIAFATYDGQSNQEFSEFPAPNGADGWHHFALVREGTGVDQTKFYYDGKLAGSMRVSKSLTDGGSNGIFIGHDDGPNNDLNGFLSNVRIVKGTAVYTSDFTPPTEPLTNITNTKLLCAQSASEHKDITGRLYKSGTVYTTKADIIANATPLEGGETLSSEYLYYVPSGNELTRQQVFSADGGITNSDSANGSRWGWLRHDGTNWVSITGGYGTGQFDEFYFDADDTTYQLDPNRDFYALRVIDGTTPEQNGGTAPTLKKQFALDGAVIPSSTNPVIHQSYEPTVSNFNPFTTDINTVRGQETNHCTLNPLSSNNTNITLSEGNLHYEKISTAGSWGSVYGTIGMTTGKWYWEAEVTDVVDENLDFGVTTPDITTGGWFNGSFSVKVSYTVLTNSSIGDHWGFAIDMDNRTVQMYKNGIEYQTSTGAGSYAVSPNIIPDTVETLFPCVTGFGQYQTSPASRARVNFGQKPFKFPPPDGFQPLNDANTQPETVIVRPNQYVGVTTYPGDSSQTQLIKLNMQPDLVWIKSRFVDSANHILVDSVRGDGNELFSNNDSNELAPGNSVEIKSNGFTVPGVLDNRLNGTNRDYVAWAWKAGGNKNTFNVDDVGYATAAAAGLDGGTITPTGASVGTKQGFSIISYTGIGGTNDETISHGLTQSPNLVVVKNLTDDINWAVAHTGTDDNNNRELHLNTNESPGSVGFLGLYKSNFTSTTFAVNASANNDDFVNASNQSYIAYVWHNVPGLQKFGRYEGNGDADGPYVELGFKPAILWLKNIDSDEHWYVYDSVRSSYNPAYQSLMLSNDIIEENGTNQTRVDLLSSGFKLRQSNNPNNANTYIYAAWAETPSVNLYGGQSNAR